VDKQKDPPRVREVCALGGGSAGALGANNQFEGPVRHDG
jgi:hypothetical protein